MNKGIMNDDDGMNEMKYIKMRLFGDEAGGKQ